MYPSFVFRPSLEKAIILVGMNAPLCSPLEWKGCDDGCRKLPQPTAFGDCRSPDTRMRHVVSVSTPHIPHLEYRSQSASKSSLVGFSESVRVYFFDQDYDAPKVRSSDVSVGKAKIFDGRSAVDRRRISLNEIEGYVEAMSRPSWTDDCCHNINHFEAAGVNECENEGMDEDMLMGHHYDGDGVHNLDHLDSSYISTFMMYKYRPSPSTIVSSARRSRCYGDEWDSPDDAIFSRDHNAHHRSGSRNLRSPPQLHSEFSGDIRHDNDSEDEYNMWMMENMPCDLDLAAVGCGSSRSNHSNHVTAEGCTDGETESISSILTCDASP